MPQKWAIELSVDGDLKFLSHHDMMRTMERLVRRAKLPLKYSQGFNPRPTMSLILPRPVGVASRADLLVLALEQDTQEQALLQSINDAAPVGLRAHKAQSLVGISPRTRRVTYELTIGDSQLPAIQERLKHLATETAWPFQRQTKSSQRNEPVTTQEINLRELVEDIQLKGQCLQFILMPRGDSWARPGEVLALLGLDERADLARTVRVAVDYGLNS